MYWRGRIIGLLFGLLLLKGAWGALLGFFLGYYFDKALERNAFIEDQHVFLEALFSVMGYIAKADGRVSERELTSAREVMNRLYLTEGQRKEAMVAFSRGKEPHFNLEATIQELQGFYARQPSQIKLFFTLQMEAAVEEGRINIEKQRVLWQIGQRLGVVIPFNIYNESYYGYHQQHEQPYTQTRSTATSSDDYATLGITRAASNDDIKKAYRKLMSKHHPDKLMAKGASAEKIKQATEKTQHIKAAYERICAARGM